MMSHRSRYAAPGGSFGLLPLDEEDEFVLPQTTGRPKPGPRLPTRWERARVVIHHVDDRPSSFFIRGLHSERPGFKPTPVTRSGESWPQLGNVGFPDPSVWGSGPSHAVYTVAVTPMTEEQRTAALRKRQERAQARFHARTERRRAQMQVQHESTHVRRGRRSRREDCVDDIIVVEVPQQVDQINDLPREVITSRDLAQALEAVDSAFDEINAIRRQAAETLRALIPADATPQMEEVAPVPSMDSYWDTPTLHELHLQQESVPDNWEDA